MRYLFAGAFAASIVAAGHAYAADADMVTKAPPPPAAPVWTWTLDDQAQYVSWTGNRGWAVNLKGPANGSEFYTPLGISLNGALSPVWNLNVVVRGGYVYANQSVGAFSGSVSTSTDTTLSATATYTGFNGWQPYLTVMTNLPTGQSVLTNSQTFAHMDPDLVPITMFGEGFNLGPTVGVTFLINSELSLVVNGGYTWRGAYWTEGGFTLPSMTTAPPMDIQPSAVWTGTTTATWAHGGLTLQGSGSYAVETTNYINQIVSYRAGPRITISGSAGYVWNQNWMTSIDGYWVHIDKNDVATGVPIVLIPEALNSNNDIYRINVGQMYKTPLGGGTLTLGPVGSYMHRDNNSWDPLTFQFVPAKTRYSAGGSATYAVTDKLKFGARVEHVWIHEGVFPIFGFPVVDGQGWSALVSMTLTAP